MNGESTSMVWPTLGSRTAKEQNRTQVLRDIAVATIFWLAIYRVHIVATSEAKPLLGDY